MKRLHRPNCANNGGKWLRPEKRQALYKRDSFTCVYCGKKMRQGSKLLTIDHVQPQQLGGTNAARNLVTACKNCNSSKQNKSLRGFLAFLRAQKVDTTDVPKRVRAAQNRKLKGYRERM
jgi:5-methylcytosine-specific restriction endonuclease McrA